MNENLIAQKETMRPLYGVPEEEDCRIAGLAGSKEYCRQLREMGIRERAEIRVVRRGRNYVCLVGGARVALSDRFVSCILVDRVA